MNEDILKRLADIMEQRKSADPESSYVAKLYAKGLDGILKKIGSGPSRPAARDHGANA